MNSSLTFIRPDALWQTLGLKAGQVVVHLGSGPGFYLIPAAKIVGTSGKAIGVDIRSDMLSETEGRAGREGVQAIVKTVRGDIEAAEGTKLENASADWVLLVNIIHQAHPAKILQEARRIVKPEGSIVVIGWNTAATPFGPPSEKRISQEEMTQILEQQHVKVSKTFSPSPYHYGLVAKSI